MRKGLLFFCFFLFLDLFAQAQDRFSISGQVKSVKGNVVSNAILHILNTNNFITSDAKGNFSFRGLKIGDYEIEISADGYHPVVKNINLRSDVKGISISLNELGEQLDEVLVTAQKRDENPQKLALSISVLNAKQVQDYKLWNTKDLTATMPNLFSASPGDNRNVTSIRGIATTSYDPAVTTYIDGVNQFSLDTYFAQLQDVERIEVLRGPQSTLYGSNAMGGVINMITKQPDNALKGFANVDFGNYNLQRYNLGMKFPFVKDKLFLGVSGLSSKSNGYFKNEFNQSDFDKQHSFSGNYYLKYLTTSKLSFTLNIKHAENRNLGAFPLAGSIADALENPYTVNQNDVANMVDNIFNSSLSVNYSGTAFNFSSQSAYQSNYRIYKQPIDADFSPLSLYSQVNNYGHNWNNVKVATQEFRFSSPGSSLSKLKWVAGIYSFYQFNPTKLGLHFGEDAEIIGIPQSMLNTTNINIRKGKSFGIAGFTQGTYSFTEKFNLIVGFRYDYENKSLAAGEEFDAGQADNVILEPITSIDKNFNAFTPKLGLQYSLYPDNSIYGTFSRGFRAGGIDREEGQFFYFNPEYSNNFEVGSKNYFLNNLLRVNLSLFYATVNNAQVPTLVLPEGLVLTRNAGKLTSKGAEIELAIKPLKDLEINYNAGLTDAYYKKLVSPTDQPSLNQMNKRQIFTPEATSMVSAQYEYPIKNTYKIIVRGEWKYVGDQYFDLANTFQQKAYHLFNSRIGFSTQYFNLFIWGENLTKRKYIDYAYDFGAAHLGTPRIYGLSLNKNF